MNMQQAREWEKLRAALRGTKYFVFHKNSTFFMYRESDITGERNSLVLKNIDIDKFITKARKAANIT